jgi:DNA-binding response OmpR family regulator
MGLFDNLKSIVGKQATQPDSVVPVNAVPQQPKKILVVEDEQMLRAFYADLLSGEGFTVIQAENGQVGLEMIKAQKPDLVLLDVMMPVMDGKTMLHAVRALPEFSNLPVVVLTNAGDMDTIHDLKMYEKVSEFLIKSNVNPDEIVTRVRSLIG